MDYDRRRLARLARNLSRDLVDADANERETASFVALLVAEHDRLDSGDLGLTCCLDVTPHLPTAAAGRHRPDSSPASPVRHGWPAASGT